MPSGDDLIRQLAELMRAGDDRLAYVLDSNGLSEEILKNSRRRFRLADLADYLKNSGGGTYGPTTDLGEVYGPNPETVRKFRPPMSDELWQQSLRDDPGYAKRLGELYGGGPDTRGFTAYPLDQVAGPGTGKPERPSLYNHPNKDLLRFSEALDEGLIDEADVKRQLSKEDWLDLKYFRNGGNIPGNNAPAGAPEGYRTPIERFRAAGGDVVPPGGGRLPRMRWVPGDPDAVPGPSFPPKRYGSGMLNQAADLTSKDIPDVTSRDAERLLRWQDRFDRFSLRGTPLASMPKEVQYDFLNLQKVNPEAADNLLQNIIRGRLAGNPQMTDEWIASTLKGFVDYERGERGLNSKWLTQMADDTVSGAESMVRQAATPPPYTGGRPGSWTPPPYTPPPSTLTGGAGKGGGGGGGLTGQAAAAASNPDDWGPLSGPAVNRRFDAAGTRPTDRARFWGGRDYRDPFDIGGEVNRALIDDRVANTPKSYAPGPGRVLNEFYDDVGLTGQARAAAWRGLSYDDPFQLGPAVNQALVADRVANTPKNYQPGLGKVMNEVFDDAGTSATERASFWKGRSYQDPFDWRGEVNRALIDDRVANTAALRDPIFPSSKQVFTSIDKDMAAPIIETMAGRPGSLTQQAMMGTLNPETAAGRAAARTVFEAMTPGGAEAAALQGITRSPGLTGFLEQAPGRLGTIAPKLAASKLFTGAVLPAAAGIGAGILDSSDLLGGQNSGANNAVSNILRYGALGAGIGSIVPGVGTGLGALVGGLGGAGVEILNRTGVIDRPVDEDPLTKALNAANSSVESALDTGREIGVPESFLADQRRKFDVASKFISPDDPQAAEKKVALADAVSQSIQAEYGRLTNPGDGSSPEEQAALTLALQAMVGDQLKPYQDQYQLEGRMLGDRYQNLARSMPEYGDLLNAEASRVRFGAARDAFNLGASSYLAPMYQQLNRQAQVMQSQAQQIQQQAFQQQLSGNNNQQVDLQGLIQQYRNAGA